MQTQNQDFAEVNRMHYPPELSKERAELFQMVLAPHLRHTFDRGAYPASPPYDEIMQLPEDVETVIRLVHGQYTRLEIYKCGAPALTDTQYSVEPRSAYPMIGYWSEKCYALSELLWINPKQGQGLSPIMRRAVDRSLKLPLIRSNLNKFLIAAGLAVFVLGLWLLLQEPLRLGGMERMTGLVLLVAGLGFSCFGYAVPRRHWKKRQKRIKKLLSTLKSECDDLKKERERTVLENFEQAFLRQPVRPLEAEAAENSDPEPAHAA